MDLTSRMLMMAANQGDPLFSNVSLLLHFDGANGSTTFTDSSASPKTVARSGDAQISTAQSVFGGSSGLFDGTGDYLTLGGESDFAFGTGDFTIEFFFYSNSLSSLKGLYDSRPNSVVSGAYPTIYTDGTTLRYFVSGGVRISGGTLTTGVWRHVAVCRASGTTRMFLDGTQVGSNYTDSTNYINGASRPVIGALGDSLAAGPYNGYIDELRVTKGVARYTAGFTPPAAPFPNF